MPSFPSPPLILSSHLTLLPAGSPLPWHHCALPAFAESSDPACTVSWRPAAGLFASLHIGDFAWCLCLGEGKRQKKAWLRRLAQKCCKSTSKVIFTVCKGVSEPMCDGLVTHTLIECSFPAYLECPSFLSSWILMKDSVYVLSLRSCARWFLYSHSLCAIVWALACV